MNSEIFLMIDSYVDGELDRNEEEILFEQLASNPEARNYLRKVNVLNNQLKLSAAEFPPHLERDITNSISRRTASPLSYKARFAGYISAGISTILLIISLFLLLRISGSGMKLMLY